ncbi:hypothetical protein RZR97_07905 [Hydrogenimonas thermophila]|uniref:phosphoribosyltransferase n=1 Tax=Hydrogenimonas thermophila TaxID=223786 RepID=UPI002936DCB3|nr:hypothetical protein [Hydrogenimonas thermophila]WOE69035.1 hypothetical protein RZR91_07930 [Hydrogenimonas thermophila]WOE71545.1 hypothetical protein RZR97_07905 [Hydrogenimonas thermophila]
MNYQNFKIIIKTKKAPIVSNHILSYLEDKNRKTSNLYCEIYYNNILISKGIVLDFYKEFENIVDFFGNISTHILTFEWQDKLYTKNTYFGQKIFEIKNFINPPLDLKKRKNYLDEITSIFDFYVKNLIQNSITPIVSYIPSSSKIPDDIAYQLANINNLEIAHIIKKNTNVQSKVLTTVDGQNFNKYIVDLNNSDKIKTFLIIDDVFGTGATFCEVMYKLYTFNQKINYFLAIVKDVRR